VENYAKFRPSYPPEVVTLLGNECGLSPDSVVADVGSGTGISSRLFLDRAWHVIGVEPNDDMRAVAERDFKGNPRFTSVARKAEETGLPARSVDLVVTAQAFHWLDRPLFRAECLRILKPGGWVSIIWNNRKTKASPFLVEYEDLLSSCGTDYTRVNHTLISKDEIRKFYGGDVFRYVTFPNEQVFDWDGLLGRALSSSYVPLPEDAGYAPLIAGLKKAFDTYAVDGKVTFEYDTEVYLGQPE
jgi:SAM-dependent methyltransferase